MRYQLIIKSAAEREIDRLARTVQRRVTEALACIQEVPRARNRQTDWHAIGVSDSGWRLAHYLRNR